MQNSEIINDTCINKDWLQAKKLQWVEITQFVFSKMIHWLMQTFFFLNLFTHTKSSIKELFTPFHYEIDIYVELNKHEIVNGRFALCLTQITVV